MTVTRAAPASKSGAGYSQKTYNSFRGAPEGGGSPRIANGGTRSDAHYSTQENLIVQ